MNWTNIFRREVEMQRTLIVSWLCFAPCLSLTGLAFSAPPPTTRPCTTQAARDELAVYESVFRHQMNRQNGRERRPAAYFLSISKDDPTPEFLKRFEGNTPPVLAGSKFKRRAGLYLWLETICWLDDNTTELRGGYYNNGLDASDNLYRVVRKGQEWVVEKDTILSQS